MNVQNFVCAMFSNIFETTSKKTARISLFWLVVVLYHHTNTPTPCLEMWQKSENKNDRSVVYTFCVAWGTSNLKCHEPTHRSTQPPHRFKALKQELKQGWLNTTRTVELPHQQNHGKIVKIARACFKMSTGDLWNASNLDQQKCEVLIRNVEL